MVSAPAKPVTADWPERFPESCPLTEELVQLCIANDGWLRAITGGGVGRAVSIESQCRRRT